MEWFKYFVIGLVQGLTEFLPVSSSGHIVLFGSFFDMDNLLLISVVAHLGTLFAVLFCYRKKLSALFKQFFCDVNSVFHRQKIEKNTNTSTYTNLILATIPTILIVLVFNKFFEDSFAVSSIVWGFMISAILLIFADFKSTGNKYLTKKSSLFMGVAQGLAVLPGISRSGTTLMSGLFMGVNKTDALDFSFLMSIPIIIASGVYEGIDLLHSAMQVNWLGIAIVLVSSFIFGILSIKLMLKVVNKNRLFYFSFYLIFLSLIMLVVL